MISLVVKSSRASLSRVFNNGLIIEHSKPISSLALSVKTITTLCCFLILITNSIASPMELTRSFRGSDEIEELKPAGTVASKVKEDSQSIKMPEIEKDPSPYQKWERQWAERLESVYSTIEAEQLEKADEVKPEVNVESDLLLAMLPFQPNFSPDLWEAIYIPPIEELPKRGRYPLKRKPWLNLKLAGRDYVFRFFISNQLQNKLKDIVKGSPLEPIQKALQDTTRLYPPLDPEMGFIERYLNIARSWFAPPALKIFQSIELLFRMSNVSTVIRQELWTFMMYHAFHSSTTEKYLISLYRTNEFRQALIGYMKDLYGFDQKLNGLAWPMHKEVWEQQLNEVNQVSCEYHNFFMYHNYLLKLNRNELMELLDRDVLISQLLKNAPQLHLVTDLQTLPQNWRYQNDKVVLDLVDKSQSRVRDALQNMPGKEEHLSSEVVLEKEKELQAALNVLLHLRAYGGQQVKDRIRQKVFSGFEVEHTVDWENNEINSPEPVHRWFVRWVSQYLLDRDLLQGMWRAPKHSSLST
ncbi:hypothetical protein CROQUDRAFT_565505 [Cronartium quercuum f. sp. fusiforme G11]|uniref:Uncharacterized protein n=1 Tax=Cronartium quercuum f. sp. fusiforme G11 TaxID=708437 RepID=A0A9P6NKZ0_9BASI|nr:hypothetical protein CROQUDRAFT_565505 [Cronartium quercuum f. sp. fusiforme G11]